MITLVSLKLWAQSYTRTVKNIFDVEGEVAGKVAKALNIKLVPAEAQRLVAPGTTNPNAHDLYLRARAVSAHSDEQKLEQRRYSALQALASGRVWHLVFIYFGLQSWTPQLVKSLSSLYSNSMIGLLVTIPNLVGLAAMIFVSRSSDRMLERRYHVAIPAIMGAAALVLLGTTRSPFYSLILLSFLAAGVYSYFGPFWALPSEF